MPRRGWWELRGLGENRDQLSPASQLCSYAFPHSATICSSPRLPTWPLALFSPEEEEIDTLRDGRGAREQRESNRALPGAGKEEPRPDDNVADLRIMREIPNGAENTGSASVLFFFSLPQPRPAIPSSPDSKFRRSCWFDTLSYGRSIKVHGEWAGGKIGRGGWGKRSGNGRESAGGIGGFYL
ncbi:hypothetical protein KM043_000344 [Ampulex compressa]|nr:hypothetical protein KM043_000344 [Ampulex compressa]